MKTTLLLLTVAAALTSASAVSPAEKVMPEPFPEDRYQSIKSPFGLATPVAAPTTPDKSFADGWYISGLAHWDGKNHVTVRSRDMSQHFVLFGDDRNDNGVKLQNVEWSPIFGKTTATIEKDGQFAKLELPSVSEMAAAAPAAPINPGAKPQMINPAPGARPQPVFPQPGATQNRTAIPRPSGQPALPTAPAQPNTNYQITPGLPARGTTAQPPAPPGAPTSEGRRRVRVIPSQPTQ